MATKIIEGFFILFERVKRIFQKDKIDHNSFFINKRNLIQSIENASQSVKVFFNNNSILTFTNCDSLIIEKLKEEVLYKQKESFGLSMSSFLFKYSIKVTEIENYIEKYRNKFNERLHNNNDPIEASKYLKIIPLISNYHEVRILSPLNRTELIDIFHFKDKIHIDKVKLVELFGGNEQFRFNVSFYFARGANSIHKVLFDDHYRKRFESLVKCGIAISGDKINKMELLKTLSIKEIRAILKPHGLNCISKDKGIKLILEIPQYLKFIEPYLLCENCYFKLLPLPFKTPPDFLELIYAELNYYDKIVDAIISITDIKN